MVVPPAHRDSTGGDHCHRGSHGLAVSIGIGAGAGGLESIQLLFGALLLCAGLSIGLWLGRRSPLPLEPASLNDYHLLNLLRGTGPEGLAGMPVQRTLAPGSAAMLVRPLLGLRRAEIEAFARREGLSWREDESNRHLKYQRNVVRTAVLPLRNPNRP